MKTDQKARWQGYQFYFKEGFCWSDISSEFIKCRLKNKSVYDVKSMSLFSESLQSSDKFIVCLINSSLIGRYVKTFINGTISFQINDARQIPIVIPTDLQLQEFEILFDKAYTSQIEKFEKGINNKQTLESIQTEIDILVNKLYGLK